MSDEYLPVALAASRLGITPNAVTARLNRAAKAGSPYDTRTDGQRTLVRWEGGNLAVKPIEKKTRKPKAKAAPVVIPKPADVTPAESESVIVEPEPAVIVPAETVIVPVPVVPPLPDLALTGRIDDLEYSLGEAHATIGRLEHVVEALEQTVRMLRGGGTASRVTGRQGPINYTANSLSRR